MLQKEQQRRERFYKEMSEGQGEYEYELLVKGKTGKIQSIAVDGFDVPVRAIFETEQFAALQQILE